LLKLNLSKLPLQKHRRGLVLEWLSSSLF